MKPLQHCTTMTTQKKLKAIILRISEVLLGLALLTWYAFHFTGGCLRDLLTLLLRPLSVFLISNAIIVTVAVLSSEPGSDASNVSCRSHHTSEVVDEISGEAVTVPPAEDDPEEVRCLLRDSTSVSVSDEGRREMAHHGGAKEEGDTVVVEDLSEEEFNRTVEKYIALTRSFLHKERLDDVL